MCNIALSKSSGLTGWGFFLLQCSLAYYLIIFNSSLIINELLFIGLIEWSPSPDLWYWLCMVT